MRFVCPRCHHHLISHDAHVARCPACGLVLDMASDETADGRPALPVDRDLSGQVLGSFVVGKWIGSGGMGIVYEAEDVDTGDAVALKVLAPYLGAQPDFVERFRREAQALKQLRHPNIVSFREDGQAEGRYYIAMELLRGRSLEETISERRLELGESLRVATAVAQALQAAHARGITHRDLKPANIILNDEVVKVLDFGIAQFGLPDMTLTRSDAILGTVNYMAPEQRSGARSVGHRADIFSLGVILYRCLTGELPVGSFEPPSHFANSWRPSQRRKIDATVQTMLQREPGKRQPNTTQVLAELSAITNAPPRRVGLFAAAALAATVGAVAITSVAAEGTNDSNENESEAGKGKSAKAVETDSASSPAPRPTPQPAPQQASTPAVSPVPTLVNAQQKAPAPQPASMPKAVTKTEIKSATQSNAAAKSRTPKSGTPKTARATTKPSEKTPPSKELSQRFDEKFEQPSKAGLNKK